MHRRGVHFEADVLPPAGHDAGAGPIYSTNEWTEPTPDDFDPPRDVATGTVIQFTCTYDNPDAVTYTFGDSALTNEMCIFQGTFYPSPTGLGITPILLQPGK
jgi:hypothetical protein